MNDYIREMRSFLGNQHFIHPAARILIENADGAFLIIERTDNGQIGLPAGALERGEDIEGCIRREVWEETGLTLGDVQVIGLSTHPDRETVTYPNGDVSQYFTVAFYCNASSGEIVVHDTKEISGARWVSRDELRKLPANEFPMLTTLDHFKRSGQVKVQ